MEEIKVYYVFYTEIPTLIHTQVSLTSIHINTGYISGNSMQHIGASSHMFKSDSQTSLNRRKDSFSSDRSSIPPRTVTGWEEVPRGNVTPIVVSNISIYTGCIFGFVWALL